MLTYFCVIYAVSAYFLPKNRVYLPCIRVLGLSNLQLHFAKNDQFIRHYIFYYNRKIAFIIGLSFLLIIIFAIIFCHFLFIICNIFFENYQYFYINITKINIIFFFFFI